MPFKSVAFSLLILLFALRSFATEPFEKYEVSGDDFLNFSLQQLIDTKVTVASLSEETVAETPVPVSVITEQMIQQSGADTLKDLLLTYVPGFTNIEDQNEVNIAARGIFTSAQQKILILINGHRLNGRSYSMAAPDHSISLDKVAQIEVLRGPASALYGNVSLTATINIILKKPEELTGDKVKLTLGNYGQKGGSILTSWQSDNHQVLFWANTFSADGEVHNFAPEDVYAAVPQTDNSAIISGIKDKSPYDVGFNWQSLWGELFVNARRAHYIEPFSAAGLSGEPYPYEKFDKIDGWGPGFGHQSTHVNFKINGELADWKTEFRTYFDTNQVKTAVVIDPNAPTYGGPSWKDLSYGLFATMEQQQWGGELLIGSQLEYYKVYKDRFPIGVNSYEINTFDDNMLPNGSESQTSFFAQYKRVLTDKWHANIGVRYDHKNRKATDNVDQISPRLGLIYTNKNLNIKLSYSQAFVDATYWNRFSNLSSFKGADNLKPEHFASWQLSPTWIFPEHNIQVTSNFFYDISEDVIFRDNYAAENNYSNAGRLTSFGLEQEFSYLTPELNIRFNATYRQSDSSEKIGVHKGNISNVPKWAANFIADKSLSEAFNLHLAIRYIGKQFSPIVIQQDGRKVADPFPNEGVNYEDPYHYVGQGWLVNTNLRYKHNDTMSLNLRVDNLFDSALEQGGSTLHPYPQTGRWFQVSAEFTF